MILNIINPPSSGGVGVEVDPNSLHLTGGTMGVNATVLFPQTNGVDSEIGAWGFGVEKTTGTNAGSYSTVEPNLITVFKPYDGDYTYTTTIKGDEINVSADYGSYTIIYSGGGISGNDGGDAYWSLNGGGFNMRFADADDNEHPLTNSMSLSNAGVQFTDGTIQSTAASGLPLTGGTMTGSLNVAGNYNNLSIQVTDNEGPNWARLSQDGTITSHSDGYNDLIINSASGINLGETVFGETSKTISGTTRLEDSHTGFVLTPDASGYGPRLTFSFGNDGDPYNNLAILSNQGLLIKEEISGNVYANYSASGITFPDSSTQTTAGIPEAPIDGNAYVRKDGAWVDITTL